MKQFKHIFFPVTLLLLLFVSCKKDHDLEPAAQQPVMGKIAGKIVAANNITAISAATIFTYTEGQVYITHSDQNGLFVLEAPAGSRHITIQSGDGTMFRTEMDIIIEENKTLDISSQPVSLNQVASLAYVRGIYDKIESILIDSLGYTATAISWHSLDTLTSIACYDAIFINCTSFSTDMPAVTAACDQNLADYVANGGSLYVSDWAIDYLLGKMAPDVELCSTPRPEGFIDDNTICSRKTGDVGSILNASITSLSLQAFLNKTSIDEIIYNLPNWEKINTLDNNFWETMVVDPNGNPLLIRTNNYTNPTAGTVHIGNNANNENSLVCLPNVNGQNITLSVKSSDVASLVAAGASSGSCDNIHNAGRIYYTTFHNEPNGEIAADIKNILQYVILNL